MRVIISGSRRIEDFTVVEDAINRSAFEITELVSGGARGPDMAGERWAHARAIPLRIFPANWKLLGKAAGIHRNRQMADYADALIAVWDGESRGTKNMIAIMRQAAKPVEVVVVGCGIKD